jgi:O-antigen/teichoic acid export membrane protein
MSARKIAYNTVAQVSGKIFGFAISSFFLIILASRLGTDGMGIYTTVTAFRYQHHHDAGNRSEPR